MGTGRTLLAHHFPLSQITGVTVMLREIIRQYPRVTGHAADYLSYPATTPGLQTALDGLLPGVDRVIGINLQIEVLWEQSSALADRCLSGGIPLWVYVHDYWPHHFDNLNSLVQRGSGLLASSEYLQNSLASEGFRSTLLPVGIPMPAAPAPAVSPWPAGSRIFASAGRLVPRKHFSDIARAFRYAGLGDGDGLYLRLLPSYVYGDDGDAEQIRLIEAEIPERDRISGRVRIDRLPSPDPFDYSPYFAYLCSSAYEGFSMSPLEAIYAGCPPLLSDIPAHKAIAGILFGDLAGDFLYPLGHAAALAELMRDEVSTERRRKFIAARLPGLRATIETRWSLATTARALDGLGGRSR